jgi:dephospho-CoA kinase
LKKQSNFILLSVDADQKVRYERALQRNSTKDHIDFDTFKKQEVLEASNEDINK